MLRRNQDQGRKAVHHSLHDQEGVRQRKRPAETDPEVNNEEKEEIPYIIESWSDVDAGT